MSLLPKKPGPPVLEPVDLNTWDDGDFWGDEFYLDANPDYLDEPWPYRFKNGEKVWVCGSDGNWYHGKVVGHAKCGRSKSEYDALYWCAEFKMGSCKVRKWITPLDGEIKPDNKNTGILLWKAGVDLD